MTMKHYIFFSKYYVKGKTLKTFFNQISVYNLKNLDYVKKAMVS